MIYEILDRNLIFPGLDAPKMEDVMTRVGGALTKAGYAKDTYVEALIAREPRPAPKLVIDPDVTDFYAFTPGSFRLEGYDPWPFEEKIEVAI